MNNLGFELPNGFKINPVLLDCCLDVDGFGSPGIFLDTRNNEIDRENSTTILKSITRHPRIGNYGTSILSKKGWAMTDYGFPLPKMLCYTPIGGGSTVNSVGLTNDGFDNFLNMEFAQEYIIPSIFFEFGKGSKNEVKKAINAARYMGEKLRAKFCLTSNSNLSTWDGKTYFLAAVVINISCPNDGNGVIQYLDDIVEVVKAFKNAIGDVPIGIKYSYVQDIQLAIILEKEVDIAFHQAINSIPFRMVFDYYKFSPLSHIGHGGVSGTAIKEHSLDYLIRLRCALPKAKIISGGGISNIADALERLPYCDAIALGILVNKNPTEANEIINHFKVNSNKLS